jgi:hypothetical protein
MVKETTNSPHARPKKIASEPLAAGMSDLSIMRLLNEE